MCLVPSVAIGNLILVREWRNGQTPTDNTAAPGDGPAAFSIFFSFIMFKLRAAFGEMFSGKDISYAAQQLFYSKL